MQVRKDKCCFVMYTYNDYFFLFFFFTLHWTVYGRLIFKSLNTENLLYSVLVCTVLSYSLLLF